MSGLMFFPAPYPGELFYSVMSRFHSCCGNPSAKQTSHALWDRTKGRSLFFPAGVENIAVQTPEAANLTAEKLIYETTIFPFLNPFMSKSNGRRLIDMIRYGTPNFSILVSLFRNIQMRLWHLRYCEECAREEILDYGEPYWHSLHQLPGVFVCPKHAIPLIESHIKTASITNGYYPLMLSSYDHALIFNANVNEKLANYSSDAEWMLKNGKHLCSFEHTLELYDHWMRLKGFRDHNGDTGNKKLSTAIVDYYGQEVLSLFGAYDSGACTWINGLTHMRQTLTHPMYHLLVMRFLAGSAEKFFMPEQKCTEEYLPFDTPPYPCRNRICEYYLCDVIGHIEIINVHSKPSATFVCPYCGFSYRKKGNVLKSQLYDGVINIVDYGSLWQDKLKYLLSQKVSIKRTARVLQSTAITVKKYGGILGLIPEDMVKPRKSRMQENTSASVKPDLGTKTNYYRQRLLTVKSENPNISRSGLILLDSMCIKWLRENDIQWYEKNAPPPRHSASMWLARDDEYMERLRTTTMQLRALPGRPQWLNVKCIGMAAKIDRLNDKLATGNLPKTKAFLRINAETVEEWQKRKLLWSAQQLREQGVEITKTRIKQEAAITDSKGHLNEFIQELLHKTTPCV